MAERNLCYFVADVHLGLDVKDMRGREARFVSFLKSLPKDRTAALYMLGDIWDFWYEYHDVVPKGYVRVFAALLELQDAGVRICFFPGNHDIWTYSYFRELGFTVLEQPYLADISGRRFCLGHGDGLGDGMRGYKLMRWTFHNRFFQAMFSLLHPWIAFRLGKGWSKKSRLAKSIPYAFRGPDEPLYRYADSLAREKGVDFFIFGHYHCSVRLALPSGADFNILRDWMDASPYAVFDGVNLSVEEFRQAF